MSSSHPSHDVLLAYQVGELSETTAEDVTEHVSTCPDCQTELAILNEHEDSLVASLRRPIIKNPYADEPQFQEAMKRVDVIIAGLAKAAAPASPGADETQELERLGEYELLAKLGEGGMGAVYKARQTNLGRLVALKVLPKDRAGNQVAIARFYREMRAVGQLSHPNIVQAFDAREIDGSPVLAMEYVDGLDLAKLVSVAGPLRVEYACDLVRQAAVGLQHAHEQGLVHRDIKPSNLMLNRQGTVKILDLGLALLGAGQFSHQEMTAAGSAMGTADYISPEQVADSHNVTISSDIYSLGCTLYKLLSGRAPFVGPEFKNDVTKMMAHVQQTPPPISLLRTDLPPGMAAVVERMMAKKPADRFATPGEVAIALGRFAGGCDLVRLLNEANGMLGLATVEMPPSASAGRLSSSPQADTRAHAVPAQKSSLKPASGRGAGRRRIWVVLAVAAAAIPLLLGIWVIIRDRSGKEVGRIQVPDGGTATVETESEGGAIVPPGWHLPVGAPPPAIASFDVKKAKEHQKAWAKYLGVKVEIENSIGMKFMLIPPGEFDMGSTEEDVARLLEEARAKNEDQWYIGRLPIEAPKHRVRITKPFYLGLCEVTQAEYERVVDNNPSSFKDDLTRPVETVFWDEASAFCRKLGELPQERATHGVYRLPSEAEWEYACRAGATTEWSSGDNEAGLKAHAWFNVNAGETTHPVRQKAPNPWGLYDMHGNVWEWCSDWFGEYAATPVNDPTGTAVGSVRVLRGGCWGLGAAICRSAARNWIAPGFRDGSLGFRLARTVPFPPG